MSAGRKAGRELTDVELRYLRLLLDLRTRALKQGRVWDVELEDFVLELRESGASARGLAVALEVGPSTIQTWTTNARRRRESK